MEHEALDVQEYREGQEYFVRHEAVVMRKSDYHKLLHLLMRLEVGLNESIRNP